MKDLLTQGFKRLVGSTPSYPRGERSAHITAIATVKGGVGKTTTAVNLAWGLAKQGRRVLLLDLDAQGHCASSLRAEVPAAPVVKHTVSQILLSDDGLQMLDAAFATTLPTLDMTQADPSLAEAEGRLGQKIGKEQLLAEALSITATHYDDIILDCPPNKGNLTLNALMAAHEVLIPTDLSPLGVQGVDELLGTVMTVRQRLKHPLNVLGVLFTRVDGRTSSMNDAVRERVAQAWEGMLFETEIGINTALAHAQMSGESIFSHDPKSRGAKDYTTLVEEVLRRRSS